MDKKLSFYFMFSFFLISFKFFAKSVDRWTSSEKKSTPCISLLESKDIWTRSCLSISYFLSFLYPLKYLEKVWTGGQELWVFWKKGMYFIIQKCGHVDKKLFFILCFLCFLYPLIFRQKVWIGGQALNILKKNHPHVCYYSKVWTCRQEAAFLFHVFFLPCTLQNHVKKYGQVYK